MMFKLEATPIGGRLSKPGSEAGNELFIGYFDERELITELERLCLRRNQTGVYQTGYVRAK